MGKIQLKREYLTNRMIDLKRAGLLNRDIDLLTRIKKYEAEHDSRTIYYTRLSEHTMQDKNGCVIDPASLPFPRWEAFNHFFPIEIAKRYEEWMKNPGALYNSLDRKNDERDLSICIYEVPDETTFPLPNDFDWMQHCLDWLKQFDYTFKYESRHRLSGIETAYVFSYATPKDPLHTLSFISVNQFTESEIEEMIEEKKHQKG